MDWANDDIREAIMGDDRARRYFAACDGRATKLGGVEYAPLWHPALLLDTQGWRGISGSGNIYDFAKANPGCVIHCGSAWHQRDSARIAPFLERSVAGTPLRALVLERSLAIRPDEDLQEVLGTFKQAIWKAREKQVFSSLEAMRSLPYHLRVAARPLRDLFPWDVVSRADDGSGISWAATRASRDKLQRLALIAPRAVSRGVTPRSARAEAALAVIARAIGPVDWRGAGEGDLEQIALALDIQQVERLAALLDLPRPAARDGDLRAER